MAARDSLDGQGFLHVLFCWALPSPPSGSIEDGQSNEQTRHFGRFPTHEAPLDFSARRGSGPTTV